VLARATPKAVFDWLWGVDSYKWAKLITPMQFNYIKNRFTFYTIAATLFVGSLATPFFIPLNLGIDMTGGTQSEFRFNGAFDKAQVESAVNKAATATTAAGKSAVTSTSAYRVTGENIFVVEAGFDKKTGTDAEYEATKTLFKDTVARDLATLNGASLVRYVNIGESFGDYIKKTAYITLALVILSISLYIAYAFRGAIEGYTSFSFGFVTAVSLFHDVIVAFGLFVVASYFFPEYKIDTFFITAMLTVLGYSINDTIVVMDRIRSNLALGTAKRLGLGEVINNSINDTLTRSIFTSLTVVIVLVALYLFGPQAIHGFALALIFGTLVGTYSSVCLAAPLLYDITKSSK
jgi:preprotein translocase SecF subunit